MFKRKKTLKLVLWVFGIILIFGVAACAPDVPIVDELPSVDLETPKEIPEVIEPTDTATVVVLTPTVVLVPGAQVNGFTWSQTQQTLERLTADASHNLVILDSLNSESLSPEVQVVVGVGPGLDLNGIAANAPDVAFVAVDNPDAVVADNLSLVGGSMLEMRQQAFMAGYLSALISSDYKIAALFPAEGDVSNVLAESYIVGARFLCGICQPLFPPYNAFPQYEILTTDSDNNGFRSTVENFSNIGVEIVYVHGELAVSDLLDNLAELDIKVVSDTSPDILRGNWVGTISTDPGPALEALWSELLEGSAGVQIPSLMVLTDRDMGLVPDGRYRLFEDMLADLQAGLISVEITP